MGKRKYYMPPKRTPTPRGQLNISADVKAELRKLAEEMVTEKEQENITNYITLSLLALRTLGYGKDRLNRYLEALTTVSEEATNADDVSKWYADKKMELTNLGCAEFREEGGTDGIT